MMRAFHFIVPLALVALALVFVGRSLEAPDESAAAAPRQELPRYAVTGAVWVRLGRNGDPEFRAQADQIDYYADDSARLHSLVVDTLGGSASPWHLQATEGEVPPHERSILLKGEVSASSRQARGAPLLVTTDRLWVDLLRRQLHTDRYVKLSSDFRRASARGLRADFSGERVQLLNEVQVDYAPDR